MTISFRIKKTYQLMNFIYNKTATAFNIKVKKSLIFFIAVRWPRLLLHCGFVRLIDGQEELGVIEMQGLER